MGLHAKSVGPPLKNVPDTAGVLHFSLCVQCI